MGEVTMRVWREIPTAGTPPTSHGNVRRGCHP